MSASSQQWYIERSGVTHRIAALLPAPRPAAAAAAAAVLPVRPSVPDPACAAMAAPEVIRPDGQSLTGDALYCQAEKGRVGPDRTPHFGRLRSRRIQRDRPGRSHPPAVEAARERVAGPARRMTQAPTQGRSPTAPRLPADARSGGLSCPNAGRTHPNAIGRRGRLSTADRGGFRRAEAPRHGATVRMAAALAAWGRQGLAEGEGGRGRSLRTPTCRRTWTLAGTRRLL